eukprot:CAMPEP_0179289112 /NCGR_PEP_ID=MMETSP0797-20121207/41131_1 /TAXON_ID=47934 /ORGANISM="Dinophysis acuminata, Strain DAEP01" /LENGTH=282 /DNA_ID=CAMNT_0020998101 /DNA_START=33 /DNA_END=878 /DNA_ORIENTATION=+
MRIILLAGGSGGLLARSHTSWRPGPAPVRAILCPTPAVARSGAARRGLELGAPGGAQPGELPDGVLHPEVAAERQGDVPEGVEHLVPEHVGGGVGELSEGVAGEPQAQGRQEQPDLHRVHAVEEELQGLAAGEEGRAGLVQDEGQPGPALEVGVAQEGEAPLDDEEARLDAPGVGRHAAAHRADVQRQVEADQGVREAARLEPPGGRQRRRPVVLPDLDPAQPLLLALLVRAAGAPPVARGRAGAHRPGGAPARGPRAVAWHEPWQGTGEPGDQREKPHATA